MINIKYMVHGKGKQMTLRPACPYFP